MNLQDARALARAVHGAGAMVRAVPLSLLAMLVGCVIPPSLKVEEDAGVVNSPPAIMSVTSDQQALAEPGPVLFERGDTAGNVRVSLIDTDTTDVLYVRVFVDYNLPERLPPRVACTAAASATPVRTATCNMAGLCATADIGVQRNMTIVVFDRPPLDFGSDPQAMPADGLSTSRFYFLKCQPPQT